MKDEIHATVKLLLARIEKGDCNAGAAMHLSQAILNLASATHSLRSPLAGQTVAAKQPT